LLSQGAAELHAQTGRVAELERGLQEAKSVAAAATAAAAVAATAAAAATAATASSSAHEQHHNPHVQALRKQVDDLQTSLSEVKQRAKEAIKEAFSTAAAKTSRRDVELGTASKPSRSAVRWRVHAGLTLAGRAWTRWRPGRPWSRATVRARPTLPTR
jgi:hypothetical protein